MTDTTPSSGLHDRVSPWELDVGPPPVLWEVWF
jgi:hypothetical protein